MKTAVFFVALIYIAAIAGCVYLISNGQTCWGIALLLIVVGGGASIKRGGDDADD